MYDFGAILLAEFPFTNLSGAKSSPDMVVLDTVPATGLRDRSVVRFDTLATLDKSLLHGHLGSEPPDVTAAKGNAFSDYAP